MEHDVIVIGAGLAGLETARLLRRRALDVQVVEARDRVGGRTWSLAIDDARFDVGGQWLGAGHRRLTRLAAELGVATFPQYTHGKRLLDAGGKVSRYSGTIPKLAPWKLLEIQWTLMRLERLERSTDPESPLNGPRALELDAASLETTATRWLKSRGSRDLFAAAVRVVFGAELRDLSTLYFLSYARAGGGFQALIETDQGAQTTRLVGGAQSLSLAMAAELGARVQLGAPVEAVVQDERGVEVVTAQGTRRGRFAVLALPPPLWARIDFSPMLPVLHEQLSQRAPMGATVKVIATYERAFWREAGLSGEAVCDRGPVSVTFDASSHGDARPALVAFIVGQPARTWSSRPTAERREAVLGALGRLFGEQALRPRAYHEQDWSLEPWTRGCPTSVLSTGTLTACAPALRAPFGRVHLAGTETARECTGFMEGALESAERVTAEIAARV